MNYKQLTAFVNEEIKRIGNIEYIAYKSERTYQINSGACRIIVWCKHPKGSANFYFMCFDTLQYYNEQLKAGFKLKLHIPTAYMRDATIIVI